MFLVLGRFKRVFRPPEGPHPKWCPEYPKAWFTQKCSLTSGVLERADGLGGGIERAREGWEVKPGIGIVPALCACDAHGGIRKSPTRARAHVC